MEIDITKLREQRRPLWMTHFGIESFSDMLGGGGDIRFDRNAVEWDRFSGIEIEEELAESRGVGAAHIEVL